MKEKLRKKDVQHKKNEMINNADETSNSNLAPMHPNDVTEKKVKCACFLETLTPYIAREVALNFLG